MGKWGAQVRNTENPKAMDALSWMPLGLASQITGPLGAGFQCKDPTIWVLAARSSGPGSWTANCWGWVSAGRPLVSVLTTAAPCTSTVDWGRCQGAAGLRLDNSRMSFLPVSRPLPRCDVSATGDLPGEGWPGRVRAQLRGHMLAVG